MHDIKLASFTHMDPWFADFSFQQLLQLPTSMRGGNGKVAYIDTEGTLYDFLFLIPSLNFNFWTGYSFCCMKR